MMLVWASAPPLLTHFPLAPGQERERQAGADISYGELWVAIHR